MENQGRERQGRIPPYVPYRTWNTLLSKLKEARPLPSRMDSTFWAKLRFSGSMESALKAALIYLELASPQRAPSQELETLLSSQGEARRELLKGILEKGYGELLSQVDLERATPGQLREHFRQLGADGEMGRKCLTFFLGLARDAGFKLHPHLMARGQPERARRRGARAGEERMPRREDMRRVERPTPPHALDGIPEVLRGLLGRLPPLDKGFRTEEERGLWKKAFDAAFDYLYPGPGVSLNG